MDFNAIVLYLQSLFSSFFTHSLSVVVIGFNQIVYRVKESVGALKVCASVKGNIELDRAVVVQYGTEGQSTVGMMCVYVCICVCACMCAWSRMTGWVVEYACVGGYVSLQMCVCVWMHGNNIYSFAMDEEKLVKH